MHEAVVIRGSQRSKTNLERCLLVDATSHMVLQFKRKENRRCSFYRIILPFLQSYVTAAHFTIQRKILAMLKENAIVYGSLGLIFGILLIYVVIKGGLNRYSTNNIDIVYLHISLSLSQAIPSMESSSQLRIRGACSSWFFSSVTDLLTCR